MSIGAFTVPATATAGVFRISRTGKQIHGYYELGGGWVLLGSFPSAYSGDMSPKVGVSGQMSHVAFDSLSAIVTPVHPAPDLEANGGDGPLTITAGAPLQLTISLEPNAFLGLPGSECVVAMRQTGNPFWYLGAAARGLPDLLRRPALHRPR